MSMFAVEDSENERLRDRWIVSSLAAETCVFFLTGLDGGDGAWGWLLLRFRSGLLAEVGGEGEVGNVNVKIASGHFWC